jgi:Peptidase family M1 domain
MRRFLLAAALIALHATPDAQSVQNRPSQADGVVRLLSDLETALTAGKLTDFQAMSSARMPPTATEIFRHSLGDSRVTTAVIRERTRKPLETGFEVLAEVLVSHGRDARVSTWVITAQPRTAGGDRYEIADLIEPAAVDGLTRLTLDTSKQYSVRNLSLQAPDLVVKMSSGAAFVAEDSHGPTAIVLRGRGEVRFSPPDAAEQGQLQAFSGRTELSTTFDQAFIRINSSEFADRVADQSLVPGSNVDPGEVSRAQAVFDDLSVRTYNLNLRDLSPERWSLSPTLGSVVVEMKTSKWGWLTYARSPGEAEDVALFDRSKNRNISSYASAERLASRGRFYSEDDDVPYDVERYNVDVRFDPARQWVAGRGSLRLKVKATMVSTLTFRLAEALDVSSVSSPNFGRLLALRIVGQNNIIVNLPSLVAKDTVLSFDFEYSGRLNPQVIDREAAMPQGLPGQPQGTNIQPQETSPFLVEPEPRYLYSTHVYWYPQAPVTDYATASLRLRMPSEFQVTATGSFVNSSVGPDQQSATGRGAEPRFIRTVEYAADRPARYLSCLISRFTPVGKVRAEVPALAPFIFDGLIPPPPMNPPGVNVEVVATPRMTSKNRQLPARVADILRVYSKIIGEAPYPDLTVAAVDDNLPGGHSPAFFSIWLQPLPTTPYTWSNDPLALDAAYPLYYLAHEIAHQWWGQAVGWKNYHEQWLSEGLAQYFSVLYAASDRGPDTMRDMLDFMRDSADTYTSKGPISLGYRLGHVQGDGRIFRAISYNKSAIVLHMMRRLIGDEAFFNGLRRFYREWRFKKAGTDDFRVAMQAESPIKLERFFDRWIFGTALPQLRVTSKIDQSNTFAVIRIEQIGDVFDLPYTVTVQYMDGKSEAVTIPVTDAVVEHKITFKGPIKRIETRDDLTLADIVK